MRDFGQELFDKANSIGEPLENYHAVGGLYVRDFSNGKVLVNPTSSNLQINLEREYENLDGEIVSGDYTVYNHTGEILFKTTTTPECLSEENDIGQDGCSADETCCCKSGLVGYWKFDESSGPTASDSSFYNNNGTINGASWYTDCISGSCLSFDGTDDYVSIPLSSSLDIRGNEITVAAWVNPYGTNWLDQQWQHLVDNFDAYFTDILGDRTFTFRVEPVSGSLIRADGTTQAILGNWYHVVGVVNTSHVLLYVNGDIDGYGDDTFIGKSLKSSENLNLLIGKFQGSYNYNFNGTMDEVKIWNYALSEEEIKNDYSSYCDNECTDIAYDSGVCRDACQAGEDPIPDSCASGDTCCCKRPPAGCSGSIDLYLSPNPVYTGRTVTASVSGLSDCDGETVYIKKNSCDGTVACDCLVSGPGCSCNFNAPGTIGSYTYYACVDITGDDDFLDPGEYDSEVLVVRYPSAGGCPTLFVYDGKEYKEERISNIHSEEGMDTVDEIVLETKTVEEDGYYRLNLKEQFFPGHSYIDSVKLFVDGEEAKLISAWHSKYGDVTSILGKSDDVRTDTKLWDEIELKFEAVGNAEYFIFKIEGYNPLRSSQKTKIGIAKEDLNLIAVISAVTIIVLMFSVMKFLIKK